MDERKRRNLVFAVNRERFELSNVDPSMTLLEFLRTKTKYKGPKLGCGEGGCGACVVHMSIFDPQTNQIDEFAVSSCLTLLCSVHLCSMTTTEGLGNSRDGFHAIHQRFSGFHASQCGFCTPGMCMSLFSALRTADKSFKPETPPPAGFSNLTVSEAEKAVAGNLCRGYRPIADVCKSFASNVDIEDLGLNSFWRMGVKGVDIRRSLPFYDRDGIETFPDFLRTKIQEESSAEISTEKSSWYRPHSIHELRSLLKLHYVERKKQVKLVAGNTCSGVYKDLEEEYDKYIDIRGIPELSMIRRHSSGIDFGAAVTISKAIETLKRDETPVFSKIAAHLSKVASQFVRNTATLGGNLIMANKYAFASDIATVLLAAGSSVSLETDSKTSTVTLEEFLQMPLPVDLSLLLLSIRIPSWKPVSKTTIHINDTVDGKTDGESDGLFFETYRASPRPNGNAVSYVNAAFFAQLSSQNKSGSRSLENLSLVFGAYGSEHAIKVRAVEKYLLGKSITSSVMLEAIKLLRETILPKEGTSYPAYRCSLAVGFLFHFLHLISVRLRTSLEAPLSHQRDNIANEVECINDYNCSSVSLDQDLHDWSFDQFDHCTPLVSSKQVIEFSENYLPVGDPTKKVGADIQASGEAIYVDDIPSPRDCLHGAFVYSTKPMVLVKGINFKSAFASEKVVSIISAKDIPDGGRNIGAAFFTGEDPLFAESITEFAGQPLALVIADTQRAANTVAALALVEYGIEDLESPIFSVEDAVKKSSFFKVPAPLVPKQIIGDFSKAMEGADHQILSSQIKLHSQYYFYMETQTALAIPDEDNCLTVYTSSQNPMLTQGVVAKCIGIPSHNVRVITRRVGGGFGGKGIRSLPVATACALAAYKLQKPVRMYLDRKTDMVITGGRHPMTVNYSVGFNPVGKITALHVELLINAGITKDVSLMMPSSIIGALKKYNWGTLSCDFKLCKTNLTTKSAMRAPGELQGSYIAEAVIEHVASTLSMDPYLVRMVNMHSFESLKLFHQGKAGEPSEYTLPHIIKKLVSSANFEDRVDNIRVFNVHNRWRKRGISCVPVIYPVTLFQKPGKVGILHDGSIVVEVGGIVLGQGLWTKVKQVVAFSLGQLCRDSDEDLFHRVRVVQADTLSLIQGGITAGSTTSEGSCEAARLACNILVDRLMPVKEKVQKKNGSVSWDTLIDEAAFKVNLSASSYFVPEASSRSYLNYGAAISEVEIDLLTGATTILRSDLIYDCGQSLNPAVDLGQIEGAFVQGIGFFMLEEYSTNSDGLVTSDGTWTYKVPTVDTIPKQFNVELLNSGHHEKRVLSSKASGEPPLLLAASVHCATRDAIKEARKELFSYGGYEGSSPLMFQLPVPATMPVVKELCGFDNVERYLQLYTQQSTQ